MTISASDLYIVVNSMPYCGLSGDTENIYTGRAEAEADAEERSRQVFCGMTIRYYVMDLSDYISEVRSEARDEGRRDERDSF